MRRRVIEIVIVFLNVLAVIAFAVSQAEQAFLKDGISPIPERDCEAELLGFVGDAGQTILAPAVSAGPGLIVREIVPCISSRAVILADGAPLPFGEIRPPLEPWDWVAGCISLAQAPGFYPVLLRHESPFSVSYRSPGPDDG